MGTAADKILSGEVDPDRIDDVIAACVWCQIRRGNRECWHQAARVLLAHGLRPGLQPDQRGDVDQGAFDL